MNVSVLNQYFSGIKSGDAFVVACHRKKPISMNYIESEYGPIIYSFNVSSPSYNLKYKSLEVDIDYTFDNLENGYKLKAALYNRDQIIGFKNLNAIDLRNGLIEVSESLISNYLSKTEI